MKALELSRRYWEEYARTLFLENFPDVMSRAAVGLCGSGSDCLGYDDEVSLDHDIAAGFMLWIQEEDMEEFGFRLSNVYDRLPKSFLGFSSSPHSRMQATRYGVHTASSFFRSYTGSDGAPENWRQWLALPSWSLASAVAGEIFFDGNGQFTAVREKIRNGMPEDIRLKKIAAKAALMAQAGQYNYHRCLMHGEKGAARLAADEYVHQGLELLFLLNRQYMPYYKWAFRAARDLPLMGELSYSLETVLAAPSESLIEEISSLYIEELRRQKLTDGSWDYLEPHAFEVMERIKDPEIAALHVMEG